MSDNEPSRATPDTVEPLAEANPDQAELAHSIIESLLDHTKVVSDLIALMAQALDQDTTKALIQTPQWQAYLESRRRLESTRADVDSLVETYQRPKTD